MRRRSCDYFYKTGEVGNKNPVDKKRYEYLNEFGYNFDSSKKKVEDMEVNYKKHKNSDCR